MPQRTPDRQITSGPRCDRPVQGDGVMSYHCTLPQGHGVETLDPADPQPCYAVESGRATRGWAAWSEREDARDEARQEREDNEIDASVRIGCPSCNHPSGLVVDMESETGTCTNCGEKADFQREYPSETPEEIEADVPKGFEPATASDGCVEEHTPATNPNCENAPSEDPYRLAVCQLPTCTETEVHGHNDGGWAVLPRPTKQRDGDQRLPQNGDRAAQVEVLRRVDEWVADGTMSAVEGEILRNAYAESIRVGVERYGQPLRTFDGRLNIRDIADELRDALVYVTKMQMTAEADREALVRVVKEALEGEVSANVLHEGSEEVVAEIAVDRILDWVLAQRIGPEQVMPTPTTEES